MAHEIPYVATATVADLRDLEAKVHRAMALRGARYLHVLVPCPLGWGAASQDTIQRGAAGPRERRCSRCSRPSTARSARSPRSATGCPWRTYLQPQKRFAHLFGEPAAPEMLSPGSRHGPTAISGASDLLDEETA